MRLTFCLTFIPLLIISTNAVSQTTEINPENPASAQTTYTTALVEPSNPVFNSDPDWTRGINNSPLSKSDITSAPNDLWDQFPNTELHPASVQWYTDSQNITPFSESLFKQESVSESKSNEYKKDIQELIRQKKIPESLIQNASPERILRFVQSEFRYEQDQTQFHQKDYWQSPKELFQSKKGDCEDFALFTHALLQMNGIRSFVLNVYTKEKGHSVVVFEDHGFYSLIDDTVMRIQAKSIEELLRWINPYWKKGMIVRQRS